MRRAVEQRTTASSSDSAVDFSVLVLVEVVGHIQAELATQALRGMSPASYAAIDEILLVADGQVREVLQPRTVPWSG